jgi:hypothetical protein
VSTMSAKLLLASEANFSFSQKPPFWDGNYLDYFKNRISILRSPTQFWGEQICFCLKNT